MIHDFEYIAYCFSTKIERYSGRNMFGKQCIGFIVPHKEANELKAIAFTLGIKNPKVDNMGRDYIVYFPDYEYDLVMNEPKTMF